ncbi:ead/Ea22-like family protein [Klebsiella pneumoniae]|uniref:ead/Ea22-like family protein n=1 Tax=Klebsiella pneumoniae TaxID=573 RepID=UPI0028B843AB|nr:ead/Ea22-like family protein [Klebsiella pneumoniae]
MTDITELAQTMKAAAVKASGGDWVKESGDGWDATCSNDDQANSGFIIAHFVGPDSEANREFVQLANPANVLALVEALEKAQGMEAYWKTQCRGITDHCEELQARIAELESRTVKLPKIRRVKLVSGEYVNGWTAHDVACALSAAGIKVEAE